MSRLEASLPARMSALMRTPPVLGCGPGTSMCLRVTLLFMCVVRVATMAVTEEGGSLVLQPNVPGASHDVTTASFKALVIDYGTGARDAHPLLLEAATQLSAPDSPDLDNCHNAHSCMLCAHWPPATVRSTVRPHCALPTCGCMGSPPLLLLCALSTS